jgi:DNA-binding IclR family transcriptional regulator
MVEAASKKKTTRPRSDRAATAAKAAAPRSTSSRSAVQLVFDSDDIGPALANDRKFVWALARGLEILRAFSTRSGPLGNSELATITNLPKPTISRLTHTLTELGYLTFIKRLGKYEPAPAILALGYPVLSSLRVRLIAHDQMQQLAEFANLSVALGSRDRLSMIYVDVCNASSMTTLRLDIGSRVDMAHSAMGRAFLSGITEPEREYLYSRLAARHGADWPNLHAKIEDAIAQIKDRGFCIVDGDWQRDIRAVGVPLISADGTEVMALNCAGARFAVDLSVLENEIGPRLVHISRSIAPMLGR